MTDDDQRTDPATRDRLVKIQTGYERWAKKTVLILTVQAIILFALGGTSIYLLDQNSTRAHDIQRSRAQVIFNNCEEQNARNEKTIRRYDDQLQQAIDDGLVSGDRLKRARESREFTVGLINALAPQRSCRALVARRMGVDALKHLPRP